MIELLYKKKQKTEIRDCPNLESLDNGSGPHWHTMGKKFFDYCCGKFTPQQISCIEYSLKNNIAIGVEGIFPQRDHIRQVLLNENLEQIPFESGIYRISREHHNQEKKFNSKRPLLICTRDKNRNYEIKIILITFPSEEYLSQYAELLWAFIKLNLQAIIKPELGFKSTFSIELEEAQRIHAAYIENRAIKQVFYPNTIEFFPIWSGLDILGESGYIVEGDIALIGYADKIKDELEKNHLFVCAHEGLADEFQEFGASNIFSVATLVEQNNNRRIVLIGVKHSFWGKTAAKIAGKLVELGASEIIYVAKAGTRTGANTPWQEGRDPNKQYLSIIGSNYSIWEKTKKNEDGAIRKVDFLLKRPPLYNLFTEADYRRNESKNHISVPSVAGEDSRQADVYGGSNPSTIDNEISYIAEELSKIQKKIPQREVFFSCIHFITDLVTNRQNIEKSVEAGLDKDNLELKNEFIRHAAAKLAAHVPMHGAKQQGYVPLLGKPKPIEVIRSEIQPHFSLVERSVEFDLAIEVIRSFGLADGSDSFISNLAKISPKRSIVVTGESGVGKTVVAQAAFKVLEHYYYTNKTASKPIYIDISSFEKLCTLAGHEIKNSVNTVVDSIQKLYPNKIQATVIFDGIDSQSPFEKYISSFLMQDSEARAYFAGLSTIFFSRTYRSQVHEKAIDQLLSPDRLKAIHHEMRPNHQLEFDVAGSLNLRSLLQILSNHPESAIDNAFNDAKAWLEFNTNLRLVNLLVLEKEKEKDGRIFPTALSFMQHYCEEYFSGCRPASEIGRLMKLASRRAYNFVINERSFPLIDHDDILVKRLATQSTEMLCYLTAVELDKLLFDADSLDLASLDRVYPYLINKYSKELFRRRDQIFCLNKISNLVIQENCPDRLKAFLAYLLGRIQGRIPQRDAKSALESMKNTLESSSISGSSYSVIERSIYISLIVLGGDSMEYLNLLMDDYKRDAINRGFHLAYYGDIDYFQETGMLKSDNGLSKISNTHKFLLKSIKDDSVPDGLLNLQVYTLYSLVYSRFAANSLEDHICLDHLVSLAKGDFLTTTKTRIYKIVKDYLNLCVEFFTANTSPDMYAIEQVIQLKRHKRAGWNYGRREISEPESVQSHVGFAAYIAAVYLPESYSARCLASENKLPSEYSVYDKDLIIRMVLTHDVGEFREGDIASPEKDQANDIVEENAVKLLRLLPRSLDIADNPVKFSHDLFLWWREYHSGKDINAKVARDIDKIDCLATLHYYAKHHPTAIPDLHAFHQDVLDKIKTDLGKQIVGILGLDSVKQS